ncbi:MAG: funZ protein, partial [Deltaproteobacteria bacterium]|nr:funZ protein [Deltaproteobacteria bacterium]
MLPIHKLNFGFNDAENYKRKENKELFNKIFLRTDELERLVRKSTFFLLGEKGTGKTAYAVYLANNAYENTLGKINYIRETEYQKFIALKREHHLQLSDYSSIWKVILYLLMAQKVNDDEGADGILNKFIKYNNLKKAINEYYAYAFTPEIAYAINFIENSKLAAELITKYMKTGGESSTTVSFSESRFQTNLLFLQKNFEDSLRTLKLKRNHLLFIDGIDIRPSSVPYQDYLECIKGLADAVWSINNDFFSGIKDSQGRMRVVVLMRPDIFVTLGLQNQNNKIRDNSVLLSLITTYQDYKDSALFRIVDRLMSAQQEKNLALGDAWKHYFPWKAVNQRTQLREDSSFISFLRFSLYRPRDFISMLSILQNEFVRHQRPETDMFSEKDFDSPDFRRDYSDYLL